MRNSKSLLWAVALAILAGALVYWYAVTADDRALNSTKTTSAYVSVRSIAVGQSLGDALDSGAIELKRFPASVLGDQVVKVIDDTNRNEVSISAVPEGQLLVAANFTGMGGMANQPVIPTGQVAVSISLADFEHAGLFVAPGSQVAVFDSYTDKFGGQPKTSLLISKALVLGVGKALATKDGEAVGEATVTLAVLPQDSIRLVQAVRAGQLYLAALGDAVDASDLGSVSANNLFESRG
ncbi:MAG: hypothetical protein RL556_384 [Actinomycetota bacterium]|jgi:pilus assembly protein CpaB